MYVYSSQTSALKCFLHIDSYVSLPPIWTWSPFLTALPGEIQPFGQVKPSVVISNELSDHPPPTYLWDNDLRDYFNLLESGHILVSNVHADNHDETFQQMVTENDVPEHQFRSINFLLKSLNIFRFFIIFHLSIFL